MKFSAVTSAGSNIDAAEGILENLNCEFQLSLEDVKSATSTLRPGKDCSSVHNNHLMYLNDENLSAVQLLFNLCFKNGHVPEQMLKGIVKPMLKTRFGDIHCPDNYREVMLSTTIFKLFEYCLLPCVQAHIELCPFQFAYRKKHLNDSCYSAFEGHYWSAFI